MAEDSGEVGPVRPTPRLVERRDGDLVDQVAEEGRLGEDLDVEERRRRLQRDRRDLVAAMEPAR